MPPRNSARADNYDRQVRYILGENESPNQPVGEYLTKEYMRLKELASEKMECSICLTGIDCRMCCCLLSCGHSFHYICVKKVSICPLCRQ
jgi:hypothetical protein